MTFAPAHRCERCPRVTDLTYVRDYDEYWCDSCLDNRAEDEGTRYLECLMESGPGPTLLEQMAEARRLK